MNLAEKVCFLSPPMDSNHINTTKTGRWKSVCQEAQKDALSSMGQAPGPWLGLLLQKGKGVVKNNCDHVTDSQKILGHGEEKAPLYLHSYAAGVMVEVPAGFLGLSHQMEIVTELIT